MTEEQKKKIDKRITILSMGSVGLLIVLFLVLAVLKKIDTLWFPAGAGVLLFLHWICADVLPVLWMKIFEGKSEDQIRSYYVYAVVELIGFAGLIWFLFDMQSTTGAIIYVACLFTKKRFLDEFRGAVQEEDQEASSEEPGTEEEPGSVASKPDKEEEPGPVASKPDKEEEPGSVASKPDKEEEPGSVTSEPGMTAEANRTAQTHSGR